MVDCDDSAATRAGAVQRSAADTSVLFAVYLERYNVRGFHDSHQAVKLPSVAAILWWLQPRTTARSRIGLMFTEIECAQ